MKFRMLCAATMLLLAGWAAAGEELKQDVKVIFDFEEQRDISSCEIMACKEYPTLSDQHVTHGQKSMRMECGEHGYLQAWSALPWSVRDWSGYDSLMLDIFVEGEDGIKVSILIGDEDWIKIRTYENRHNANFSCHPGVNTLVVPVTGMFRGAANGRYHDLKTNINTKNIVRWDVGFDGPKGKNTIVYVDNVRLVKEARPPAQLAAFDFGPEDQVLYPGFTSISWNTVYGQNGAKAGLKSSLQAARFARDDTYPSRLYQDCVEIGDNSFIVDLPNGKYGAWMVCQDACYWSWEQSKFKKRWIEVDGKPVWSEERADGLCDHYWRFENIEPKPGDSVWDLYLKGIWKPQRFEVEVTDGKLKLDFRSDPPNRRATNLAGLILYPLNNKDEAERYIAEVEKRNQEEVEQRTTFLGPRPKELQVPADAAAKGYWLGFPALEEEITFVDAPGKPAGKFVRAAARDQILHYTFAVRPLKDFDGPVSLTTGDLTGPAGKIGAAEVELRYVHHALQRNNGETCYWIAPEGLREIAGSNLKLTKDLTRQFWITVHVPADAKAGRYQGEVTLTAGALTEKLPLAVEVLDLTLDESDFIYGFFGVWVPGEYPADQQQKLLKDTFLLLKRAGFNSFTGGPDVKFSGFGPDGKPQLDFTECDAYIKLAQACGFTKPIQSYGGPCGVNLPNAKQCEQQYGKPFPEVVKAVWTAIKEHADAAGWPRIDYSYIDEPRVLEPARDLLAMLKTYREAAPFLRIGGYYSVDWNHNQPLPVAIQDIFKTVVWSSLNSHSQTDLDKARKHGREMFIYNQGITRYSFGAYQFSEMMKGVKGRMQWHFLALYGFQFFNLDGRESDAGMINWGRKGPIPTLHFARCTEGANDFRFAVTLQNLAEKKKDTEEGKAALAMLEGVVKKIGVGKNGAPGDVDPYGLGATTSDAAATNDEAFRNTCIDFIRKLQAK